MAIITLLITNSAGLPLYSKDFAENPLKTDPSLITSMISAISILGRELFNEQIATISYGFKNKYNISIITKTSFNKEMEVFFVFFSNAPPDLKHLRSLSAKIYIEIKSILLNDDRNLNIIQKKVDRLLLDN